MPTLSSIFIREAIIMAYDKDLDDIMENAIVKAINAEGISYAYIVDSEGNIISNIAVRLGEEE